MRDGGRAILPWPGFEMTRRYLALTSARVDTVAWTDHAYPIEDVLNTIQDSTKLIIITSPNNPTGGVASARDLNLLAAAAPNAILLVDLAYAEFAENDLTEAALKLPQAVVVRTFSKAWGLAGCRVGYTLGTSESIAQLAAIGGPYPVAGLSLALAQAQLENGQAAMQANVRATKQRRQELFACLEGIGWNPRRSEANFVCCEPADPLQARDALAGFGIAVRAWPEQEGLGKLLRIGCPTQDADQARLLHALRSIASPQALLLDLDGVLADVSQSYRRCILETAHTYGVEIEFADVQAAKEQGGFNNDWVLTQALLARSGVELSLEEVTARFESIYQGSPEQAGLRRTESLIGGEATRACLQRLANRLPLAIVTGRPRADAQRFLQEQGIADSIQVLVGLEDAPNKPQPDPLLLAMRQIGADRAWMVGDTVDDMRAARAAACLPIGFLAAEAPLYQAGASCVLNQIEQVEAMLS
jgi:HAD superfamily hydrolase (TIGR01548 family)